MKKLTMFILFAVSIVCLSAVSGFAEEEDLVFERNHDKHENPTKIWRFQISTPSDKKDYPPSFLWHSDRPFNDSTLPLLYGNKIYIDNSKEAEEEE